MASLGALRLAALAFLIATTGAASAQTSARPPAGGVNSLPDAMIFYVAHGADGACGPGCSDWIAAEGTVQYDTHKRLIAILDRLAGRKLPLVINSWGNSSLNTAVGLSRERLFRERFGRERFGRAARGRLGRGRLGLG